MKQLPALVLLLSILPATACVTATPHPNGAAGVTSGFTASPAAIETDPAALSAAVDAGNWVSSFGRLPLDEPGRMSLDDPSALSPDLQLSGYPYSGYEPWMGGLGRQEAQEPAPVTEQDGEIGETGTDPRDFAPKFMPYFRFTELENDIEVTELVAFGLVPFSSTMAMTYELPLSKQVDYTDFPGFAGGLPPGGGWNPLPGGGVPPTDLEADGDNTGMGDLILRFLGRPEETRWRYSEDDRDSFEILPTLEMTLPTGTDDVLSGKAWVLSPAIIFVADIPGPPPFGLGFLALMNFYDFDVVNDNANSDISRYRGRYFWMQPLTKPGGILGGLYLLPEAQFTYDFENDHKSWWIAPELGKMVEPGVLVYGKPGWGIDPDVVDRDFTFEVGIRIFF